MQRLRHQRRATSDNRSFVLHLQSSRQQQRPARATMAQPQMQPLQRRRCFNFCSYFSGNSAVSASATATAVQSRAQMFQRRRCSCHYSHDYVIGSAVCASAVNNTGDVMRHRWYRRRLQLEHQRQRQRRRCVHPLQQAISATATTSALRTFAAAV